MLDNRFEALQEEENDEEWTRWCAREKRGKDLGQLGERGVLDSGAAESVCPWDWATELPTMKVAWYQAKNLFSTSGGRVEHYGEKKGCCEFDGLSAPVSVKFQVTDAKNPSASVARITEHGNTVQFGPKDEDSCIINPQNWRESDDAEEGSEVHFRRDLGQERVSLQRAGRLKADRGEYRQRASCHGSGTKLRKEGRKIK